MYFSTVLICILLNVQVTYDWMTKKIVLAFISVILNTISLLCYLRTNEGGDIEKNAVNIYSTSKIMKKNTHWLQ